MILYYCVFVCIDVSVAFVYELICLCKYVWVRGCMCTCMCVFVQVPGKYHVHEGQRSTVQLDQKAEKSSPLSIPCCLYIPSIRMLGKC